MAAMNFNYYRQANGNHHHDTNSMNMAGLIGGNNGGENRDRKHVQNKSSSSSSTGGALNPRNAFWSGPNSTGVQNTTLPNLPSNNNNNSTGGTTSMHTLNLNNGVYSNSPPVSPSESSAADLMSNSSRMTTPASTHTKYETPRTANISFINPTSPTRTTTAGGGISGTTTTTAATATATPHMPYTTGIDSTSHAKNLLLLLLFY